MLQKDFKPVLRFMVTSDVHIKDEACIEEERLEKAIKRVYQLCEESESYKKLDAFYSVGDFANSGTEIQMRKFKEIVEKNLKPETQYALTMASHEYHGNGVEAAYKLFGEVFGIPVDNHIEINGFHFITMSSSHGCEYDPDKIEYAANEKGYATMHYPSSLTCSTVGGFLAHRGIGV